MNLKSVVVIVFGFCHITATAQKSDLEASAYNILGGAILSGLSSLIIQKSEKNTWKSFSKASLQGAIGGYLTFESKRLVREYAKSGKTIYLWPSKLLGSAGSSLVYSGAANYEIGNYWFVNIGFNNIEIDLTREKKIQYRILPVALIGNIRGFINGKIDASLSIQSGTFIFQSEEPLRDDSWGFAYANSVIIWREPAQQFRNEIVAHEIIHTYHYDNFMFLNAGSTQIEKQIFGASSFYKNYRKIFRTDYNVIPVQSILFMSDLSILNWENTWFEQEPRYFDNFE